MITIIVIMAVACLMFSDDLKHTLGVLIGGLVIGLIFSIATYIPISESHFHYYTEHSTKKEIVVVNNLENIKHNNKDLTLLHYKKGKDTIKILVDDKKLNVDFNLMSEVTDQKPQLIINYHILEVKEPTPFMNSLTLLNVRPRKDTLRTTYTMLYPVKKL